MKRNLWMDTVGAEGRDAFLIGNGCLGAMTSGGIEDETLLLNEESMYYGGADHCWNPDMQAMLPKVRHLLEAGESIAAEELAAMCMQSPVQYPHAYQPLAQWNIHWYNHREQATAYKRWLRLDEAITGQSYVIADTRYIRKLFASAEDQVLVYHCTAEGTELLGCRMTLSRRPFDSALEKDGTDGIHIYGKLGVDGVAYSARLRVRTDGEVRVVGGQIEVKNAHWLTSLLCAETNALEMGEKARSERRMHAAMGKPFEALLYDHVQEYAPRFARVSLLLGNEEDEEIDLKLPLPAQVAVSPKSATLMADLGRYLLLSSSRNCALPANLQGIWNASFTPPWDCGYTLNINTQMNYWMAEPCGMMECVPPLFDYIERLCAHGRIASSRLYGARGSVAHHVSDHTCRTQPTGRFLSSPFWKMGLCWMALHLWEHYRYTEDITFLRERAYPVLREAALFCLDILWEGEDGILRSGPSSSPENIYYDGHGNTVSICLAPMMDFAIMDALFGALARCAECVVDDGHFFEKIADARARLPQPFVSRHGGVAEWLEDFVGAELGHRHISQLFSLYPGNACWNEVLRAAARQTIDVRLANAQVPMPGWTNAWMACCHARLGLSEDALARLDEIMRVDCSAALLCHNQAFQLDGNYGFTAGVVEMLLQSTEGRISLLPALPEAWASGYYTGLRTVGGHEVALRWSPAAGVRGRLTAGKTEVVQIAYLGQFAEIDVVAGQKYSLVF